MNFIKAFGLVAVMVSSLTALGKGKKMDWTLRGPYRSMQIIKYKSLSDRSVDKEVVIGRQGDIAKLVALVEKIPNGDIMVKPGPDSSLTRIVLTKANGYDRDSFDVMNDQIKTPSTAFNSKPGSAEKEAVKMVASLLEKTGVWFTRDKFSSLKMTKFKSAGDSKIVSEISTDDAEFIERLVQQISSVPADGEKMKSFAESASHASLEFSAGKEIQKIDLYEGKLKTPSTGFNSIAGDDELKIGKDVDALLAPDVWKVTPKVKNLELKMKGFSIVFKGTDVKPQDPKEPTIGPISTDTFEVRDSKGTLQTFKPTAGQTPYVPIDFKLNGESHVLEVRADSFVVHPFRGE